MKTRIDSIAVAGLLAAALLTTVVSAQNVGIGTTTPKSKLSVNGSTASGGMAIGDATYTSTTGTVAPVNGAIIQGNTGIGMNAPVYTLQVHANADQSASVGENIVAEFNPLGGQNGAKAASIVVNSRAAFGYALDLEQSKYAFLRGNDDTDIRLQVVDGNSVLYSDPFFMSSSSATPGFIGINTEAPQSRLDVRGTTKIMGFTGTQTGNFWNGTSNVDGFEVFANNVSGGVYVGIQRAGALANLNLGKPAGTVAASPFQDFLVNGTIVGRITYNGTGTTYNTTSDERLKEHIRPSAKGLDDVMKIQVSDFNYKTRRDHAETGFIAQQLNTVFPDAVTPGGEDPTKNPWTVDYGRLTPVLAKAIQEQQAVIVELKEKNARQETALSAMERENAELRAQVERIAANVAAIEGLVKAQAAAGTGLQAVSTR
jgi:hypothetical protein